MTGEVMRPALVATGAGMIALGLLPRLAGCTAIWPLLVLGLLLILGVLVERWRYRPIEEGRPGPGWIATGERFVDPETGRLVTVFYQPRTGERRYVNG